MDRWPVLDRPSTARATSSRVEAIRALPSWSSPAELAPADELVLDRLPARLFVRCRTPEQIGKLEQVFLGAGGQRLRLAPIVSRKRASSSSSRISGVIFAASLFMLR